MAGGLIGLIAGGTLGALGAQAQAQREEKQRQGAIWQDFVHQTMAANPSAMAAVAGTPEGKKMFEVGFGKEHADAAAQMMQAVGESNKQMMASFPQPGGAGPQAGGPGFQPDPSHGDPNSPDTIQKHIDAVNAWARQHPEHADMAKAEVESAQKHMEMLQKQTDTSVLRDQQQQFHADTVAGQDQQRQISQQNHADSMAMQAWSLRQSAELHTVLANMEREKTDDAKQAHFDTAISSIRGRVAGITAKMATDPETVKAQLPSLNADLKALKVQADRSGINYDEEQFKPLTVKTVENWHSKWGIGGGTPELSTDESSAPAPAAAATVAPAPAATSKTLDDARKMLGL